MKEFPSYPVSYPVTKRKLVGWILKHIPQEAKVIAEPFAGSGLVTYCLKLFGRTVLANDLSKYSVACVKAIAGNPGITLTEEEVEDLFLGQASDLIPKRWLTPQARSLLAAARKNLENLKPYKREIAVVSLVGAAIAGLRFWNVNKLRRGLLTRKAFIRNTKRRAAGINQLLIPGRVAVTNLDYSAFLKRLGKVDLIYLDPPYLGKKIGGELYFPLAFGEMFITGEFNEDWRKVIGEKLIKQWQSGNTKELCKSMLGFADQVLLSFDHQSDKDNILAAFKDCGYRLEVKSLRVNYLPSVSWGGGSLSGTEYLIIARR